MAERIIKSEQLEPLPELIAEYYPDTDTLVLETGAKRTEGEEIARGVVVFFDQDGKVVGVTVECAEILLKPFVDALLEKNRHDSSGREWAVSA